MAFCGKCGTKLSDAAKYCPVCGNAVGSTSQKNTSIGNTNHFKKKDDNSGLTTVQKWGLGICLFLFFGCLFTISASKGEALIITIVILGCVGAILGLFGDMIDRKYTWWVIGVSLACWFAINMANDGNSSTKEKHFCDLLPDNGSTTFIVEDCKPIGDDGLVIKSVEFFEKNGTRDFRLDGFLKSGKAVVLEGVWSDDEKEATYQGKEYEYYTFWCTSLDNYNFYVDSYDNLYCSFAFWDNDKDVGKAFQSGAIGKMKMANKEEVEKAAKTAQKEAEKLQAKYVGNYYYSFFIQNTNASLYFTITLKSDGTFTHSPSNETTKNYTEMESIVDGKDYPSGGTWSASNDGINLSFNGSWSGGKISADMKRLEIYNMNGYNLKTPISR